MSSRIPLFISCIFISTVVFAQKDYVVGTVTWSYTKPSDFQFREDNFKKLINIGDSTLMANNAGAISPENDRILVSVAKSAHSDMNILVASVSTAENIRRFGFDAYLTQLEGYFAASYKKSGDSVSFEKDKIVIDSVPFYILRSRITVPGKSITYWAEQYIAALPGHEMDIMIAYDNDEDKKILETSVLQSVFSGIRPGQKMLTGADTAQLIGRNWFVYKIAEKGQVKPVVKKLYFNFKKDGNFSMGTIVPEGIKLTWRYQDGFIFIFSSEMKNGQPDGGFKLEQVSATNMILIEDSRSGGKMYLKPELSKQANAL